MSINRLFNQKTPIYYFVSVLIPIIYITIDFEILFIH